MKIALVTEDGETISRHFGRATQYAVFTVEDGEITGKELRDKVSHHHAQEGQHQHLQIRDAHNHDHEHGHGHNRDHSPMINPIADCAVLIARGMGQGAYNAMEQANIEAIITDIAALEDAVKAYIDGTLTNHLEKLH